MKTGFYVFLIIAIVPSSFAQEKESKWDISLSLGVAVPVGGFQRSAPAKSIEIIPIGSGRFNYIIHGIAKAGNSYASNGQFGSLNIKYQIGRQWVGALNIHHSRNSVNTKTFYTYVNSVVNPPNVIMISNNPYHVTAWGTGLGYDFNIKQLRFSVIPIIGQAFISSPDYSFEWFTYPWYYNVIDLKNSVLLGLHGTIGYRPRSRFYTSIKFDFDTANFEYTVKLRSPGLPVPYSKDDKITYRLLKIGFTFGVRI